jgi:putative redox protein
LSLNNDNLLAMAQHEIETQWMGKMQFNTLINGHTVIMDAPEKVGGEDNGPIPKPFVLTALSGCTGMDIVAILRNAKKEVKEFDIKVIGELSQQKPMQYVSMHLIYDFKGDNSYKEAALNAVTDSQEKYCGVSAMLKKALPVTWEINYNGVVIFNNKVAADTPNYSI